LSDILSQEFNIIGKNRSKNEDYLFVSDNLNYEKAIFMEKNDWYNKKIDNFTVKYNKDIDVEINKSNKYINFIQKNTNGKAIISEGYLKDWVMNFEGSKIEKKNQIFDNYMNLTGCLTFFNNIVENLSLKVTNSKCEDAINFIKVKGSIKFINIENSILAGLDIDFSNIYIENLEVNNAKNDCVDFSFGEYEIAESKISNCGDKAISVGEKSFLKLGSVKINKSNIGIAAKDSSSVEINLSQISNSIIPLAAYRKKKEFSGSEINITKTNLVKNNFKTKGSQINFK